LFLSLSIPKSAAAQSYNAAQNFSSTHNPNGQWSYGWSETSGSAFHLLPNATTLSALDVWTSDCCGALQPLVLHNPFTEMVFSLTATVPPGSLCYGCSYIGGLGSA
jgi:hypothetical protein